MQKQAIYHIIHHCPVGIGATEVRYAQREQTPPPPYEEVITIDCRGYDFAKLDKALLRESREPKGRLAFLNNLTRRRR